MAVSKKWFAKLSPEARRNYLRSHPKSKFKTAKVSSSASPMKTGAGVAKKSGTSPARKSAVRSTRKFVIRG